MLCASVRARGHRKSFDRESQRSASSFSANLQLHQQPSNTASKGSSESRLKEALLQSMEQTERDREVGLCVTARTQENAKELDSGIDEYCPRVLHRERRFYSKRLLL